MRIAVLASGGGTNLQALLDACHDDAHAAVVLVASNRADAGALDRARRFDIETAVFSDPSDGDEIRRALAGARADLVVLAGYMKLVPRPVVDAYQGRMINVHPALLPAFGGKGMYGQRVHAAVLAAGATVSGATVHLVDAEYDRGPIVAQWPVPVKADDTPASLAARVLDVEHQLLPAVVLAAARAGAVHRLAPRSSIFAGGDGPASVTAALIDSSPS